MVCVVNSMRFDAHTCQFVVQIRHILFTSRNNDRTEQNSICRLQFHFLNMTTTQTGQHCELFALGPGQEYGLFFCGQIFDFAVQVNIILAQVSKFDSHFAEFWQTHEWHRVWITAFFDCGDASGGVCGLGKHFHTRDTAWISRDQNTPRCVFHNFCQSIANL